MLFAVGNGCTGNQVGTCSDLGPKYRSEFLGRKGLYSDALISKIKKECTDWSSPSFDCSIALSQMHSEVGAVNIYDVYAPCINSGDEESGYTKLLTNTEKKAMDLAKSSGVSISPQPGPVGCINGGPSSAYLNQVAVRSAIHVPGESVTGKWSTCSNIDYTMTEENEPKDIYPDLIKNYRVLIFNGDADSCVPFTDNEEWTSNMNYQVKSKWRPWYVNEQVAGYVTEYEQGFTFLTVKGAGHVSTVHIWILTSSDLFIRTSNNFISMQ